MLKIFQNEGCRSGLSCPQQMGVMLHVIWLCVTTENIFPIPEVYVYVLRLFKDVICCRNSVIKPACYMFAVILIDFLLPVINNLINRVISMIM